MGVDWRLRARHQRRRWSSVSAERKSGKGACLARYPLILNRLFTLIRKSRDAGKVGRAVRSFRH